PTVRKTAARRAGGTLGEREARNTPASEVASKRTLKPTTRTVAGGSPRKVPPDISELLTWSLVVARRPLRPSGRPAAAGREPWHISAYTRNWPKKEVTARGGDLRSASARRRAGCSRSPRALPSLARDHAPSTAARRPERLDQLPSRPLPASGG